VEKDIPYFKRYLYIPITGSLPSNGRLAKNITIDPKFYLRVYNVRAVLEIL
jgi:hypothetical protein